MFLPPPFLTVGDGMSNPKQFLESVLPATGKYFLFGIKQSGGAASNTVRQLGVDSIDELLEKSAEFVENGFDAFFALASYKTTKSRVVANISELKSYFLDIDCGAGKPYADASEGLKALKKYCKETGMPKPTVVSSGRGLHAYWVFDTPVSYEQWIPHAEEFKKSCVAKGFDIDLSVPADGARVLRIPGTLHLKDKNNPLPVEILTEGGVSSFGTFKELFPSTSGGLGIAGKRLDYAALDPATKHMIGSMGQNFKDLLVMSVQDDGTGCNQIKYIYENQETVGYGLWCAAISNADKCLDREKAIHIISHKHPEYNKQAALEKAASFGGPSGCEVFKKYNPAGCEGCPHKVTNPLGLINRKVIEASEEDNVVEAIVAETKQEITMHIPQYPFPFLRGKLGGVFCKGKDDEPDALVYPYDFYAVKRVKDPEKGHTIVFKLHLPKDGVAEFMIPLSAIMSKDRFRDAIATHGMAVMPKQLDLLMLYAKQWVDKMANEIEIEKARVQFGWTPDNDAIVIGTEEIRAAEIKYSPPTSQTLPFASTYQTKGSFDIWKDTVNAYGRPGMEARAFAFFMGFGSLLVRHTRVEGFVIHLMSNASGTGKSTILHAIASIYGNPKPQIVNAKDTTNAKLQIMGTLHNLPALFDEITNMPPLEKSDVVYQATQGRAKHKALQHESGIRTNTTSWETALISTGNSSLVDDLLSLKAIPDGELNRLLEFFIDKDETEDATWSRTHFGRLYDNYGHAGRVFAQYIVANLEEVIALMEDVQRRIEKLANVQNAERFWAVAAAVAITAGLISRKLGLHDIDHIPVRDFIIDHIKKSRTGVKKYIADPAESVASFLYSHLDEMVIANGTKDKRTSLDQQAIREPRGKTMSTRYEPDTKALYVSTAAYRQYCQRLQIGFEESLRPHRKSGALISDATKKRLGAGTSFSGMNGIAVLHFDASKLPNFDEKAIEDAISTGPTS